MIIVNLKGGLGNQMFQYACGRAIAIRRKEKLYLDTSGYKTGPGRDTPRQYRLHFFNIVSPIAQEDEIKRIKYPLGIISKIIRKVKAKIFHIYYIGYHPKILQKTRMRYIDGFFNSNLYFEDIRDTILSDLSVKKEFLNKETNDMATKISTCAESVAIHIRRGDYVKDKKTAAAHNTIGIPYYQKSINTIKSKLTSPSFFVFSDDIDWTKENIKIEGNVVYVSRPTLEDYEELYLMSLCKNFIIANSTFSWWGAWLSTNTDKIVIAPRKWNNKYQNEYRDLLPPEWIKI